MARKLEAWQQEELTAFVNALADAAGYTKTADWARDSDYPASNLSDLRNAKMGVDGYNLLRLIRAAASQMQIDQEVLAAGLARAIDAGSVKKPVEDRLKELSDLVARALEALEARDAQRPRADERRDRREEAAN